jgi:hypothetical protein
VREEGPVVEVGAVDGEAGVDVEVIEEVAEGVTGR